MRMVFDTTAMVAGLRSPAGASAELLRRVLSGRITMLASVALFIECEAVMTRSEHLAAAGVSEAQVANLLDAFAGVLEPIEILYLWRPQLRDPDNDMVLEVAANGGADAIVTFNRRDFYPAAGKFGIAVLSPADALRRL